MRFIFVLALLMSLQCIEIQAQAAYKPDAGFVVSHTMRATINSGSGNSTSAVNDLNTHTYWESEALLPEGFISRSYLNVFHPRHPKRLTDLKGPGFDGNLNTMQMVSQRTSSGTYRLEVPFTMKTELLWLSAKVQAEKPVSVSLRMREGWRFSGMLMPDQSYHLSKLLVPASATINGIVFESTAPFGLFELAGLDHMPWDFLTFDFGTEKEIGQVWSRHLSGENVLAINMEISQDGKHWKHLSDLDPQAIGYLPVVLPQAVMARWLRIRYQLNLEAYGKALCWELHAYDRFGPFGRPAPFVADRIPFGKKLGINAIWGWGYGTYSDQTPSGAGAEKFSALVSKARNYHEMHWDITAPGVSAGYEKMYEKGTQANWWLNWEREYQWWIAKGIRPTAAIQFTEKSVPSVKWTEPQSQAHFYGKEFAAFFGAGGKQLIQMVEIGNEPWDYPDGLYPELLLGMAGGIKAADPSMRVLPAAFQATFPKHMGHHFLIYAAYLSHPGSLDLLDGANGHFYAHLIDEKGVRIAVYPEHPASELNGIHNLIRWRNQNMPGKPVFVTEFGYDSEGASEPCEHPECVTEAQQAAWGLRAFLLLARAGASEAYWYFFANEFTASYLHTRSGLLGSVNTGFKEKQSYRVFRQFMDLCADRYLDQILAEDINTYAYLLRDAKGKQSMLVWSPENEDVNQIRQVRFSAPFEAKRFIRLDGKDGMHWNDLKEKGILPLNGYPLLIE